MVKVFISAPIPEVATVKLRAADFDIAQYRGTQLISETELLAGVSDADFLITPLSTNVTAKVITHAPKLKLIANFGAGFNNIDVAAATAHHILVTNTPAVSTDAVAEVTLGLMLALSHRIVEGDQLMHTQGFAGWQPLFFLGHELAGKTLGIVGMGHIGQAVAKRAQAFGMQIQYTQRHELDPEQSFGAQYLSFAELVATSDFVSIHAPLTSENHHLFNTATFQQMPKHAFLINAARGPIVNEDALAKALAAGEIAGAALDVYEHEPEVTPALKTMTNVILTPHIGNATVEARNQMATICADNVLAVAAGHAVTTVN